MRTGRRGNRGIDGSVLIGRRSEMSVSAGRMMMLMMMLMMMMMIDVVFERRVGIIGGIGAPTDSATATERQ